MMPLQKHCCLIALLLIAAALPACATTTTTTAVDPATLPDTEQLKLWPGDPPGEPTWDKDGPIPEMTINQRGSYRYVHEPVLDVYHAKGENRTAAAVVICPGGGYGALAYNHEGIQVAQWLNSHGITGVILRYRMHPYRHPIPMHDVQRAIQTVRSSADNWALDSQRIGVLGFSAGGHLASTATVHHAAADPDAQDEIKRVSSRPDFSILIYPVITLRAPSAHTGSRKNLLGPTPSEELLDLLSTQLQVNKQTPPTLLVHSKDDKSVPIANSALFLAALKKNGIAGKLLTYETGGHGYGLGRGPDHETAAWPDACIKWFAEQGIMKPTGQ